MIISVINHTAIEDSEVQRVIRAVNRQIAEDFSPYWNMSATLRLEGKVRGKPDPTLADQRGEAILYLWDDANVNDALGYHDANFLGVPFGFVFTQLSEELGEEWSRTLSHEALELIADPEVNLLVQGPHPKQRDRIVFHWFEMCDAVQGESYEIDGVSVSNFVLPLYFTEDDERGSRNDFLGTRSKKGETLASFGVNPGGYVGFFDPKKGDHTTFEADAAARKRARFKAALGMGRRSARYKACVGNRTAAREEAEPRSAVRKRASNGATGVAEPKRAARKHANDGATAAVAPKRAAGKRATNGARGAVASRGHAGASRSASRKSQARR